MIVPGTEVTCPGATPGCPPPPAPSEATLPPPGARPAEVRTLLTRQSYEKRKYFRKLQEEFPQQLLPDAESSATHSGVLQVSANILVASSESGLYFLQPRTQEHCEQNPLTSSNIRQRRRRRRRRKGRWRSQEPGET